MLSRIMDLFNDLKTLLKSPKEEAVTKENNNKFTNQSEKPKILGINKKITLGIIGTIATIFIFSFISSFIFNSSGSDKGNKGLDQNNALAPNTIGNSKLPPDKYSEALAIYDQKNQQANNKNNLNNQPNKNNQSVNQPIYQQPSYNNGASNNYGYTAPHYNQQASGPVYPNYNGLVAAQQAITSSNTNSKEKDSYGSAIRFSIQGIAELANKVVNAVGGNTVTASANNNQQAIEIGSYIESIPNSLQAGAIIPATLITGVNSDLPGQVVAQVRQNVYDSTTGNVLLIPQGSRLIGDYGNTIGQGQERISISWKTVILPNGDSFGLGGMEAVDGGGYIGLQDKVYNHEGKIFGSALLTSALSAVGSIATGNNTVSNGNSMSNAQLAMSGATTNLINAASKLFEKNSDIKPTIVIRPGFNFDIFVNQNLVLQPYNE